MMNKGPEARNVTGPEGKPARASRFARIINRFVPKFVPNYMGQIPQHYRQFPFVKYYQKKNNNIQTGAKSEEEKVDASPLKVSKIESKENHQKIIHKHIDENTSKTTKESGYSSTQEKTTSTSAVDKMNKQNLKKKKSKKVIYIIKDERSSGDLNEYSIKDAIQKSVAACGCTTHI